MKHQPRDAEHSSGRHDESKPSGTLTVLDIAQTYKLVRAVKRCVFFLLRYPPPGGSDECRLLGKREAESGRDAARGSGFQRYGSSLEDTATDHLN